MFFPYVCVIFCEQSETTCLLFKKFLLVLFVVEAQELAGTSGKSNDPIFDRQFLEKIESVRR